MDASSVIAVAGLTTALLGTLTVPLLQSYFTSRRERSARMDERRHTAYLDAITYAQIIEARLDDLTLDPLYRTTRPLPTAPDEVLIRAKLGLVAPSQVSSAFDELATAWDMLTWNITENGQQGSHGEFMADEDDEDVVRVRAALVDLKAAVRSKSVGRDHD
ncbi:hypothetical protein [Mycolicibacterium sp.]|uniref:hypothetical protein n=1 Tax=Mycolicibacterium sp. TaxID=2320850 RepID=UPI0037C8EFAD